MISRALFIVAAFAAAFYPTCKAQGYHLAQDFSGPDFFQGFRYNVSDRDWNNFGNVHFISQSDAEQKHMTFVDLNGRAIISVDNTTDGRTDGNFGRDTVYLVSNNPVNFGSLVVFDAVHIPFGCSVWPALFTQGHVWPEEGEIDIIENVNLATQNQYALHTAISSGTCLKQSNDGQTGKTTNGNCTVVPEQDINTGCVVQDASSKSFGKGFADSGGGVFSMLWDAAGVSLWFFERSSIPPNIDTAPDPSSWPTPSAFYPADSCDPSTAFGPQFLTLYIDICGAFAGAPELWPTSGCASAAVSKCDDLVQDPANYNNAYWMINYLRVFESDSSSSSSSSPSRSGSSPSGTASSGSVSAGTGTSSTTGSPGTGGSANQSSAIQNIPIVAYSIVFSSALILVLI
ncbi:hypothetical protein VKT23_019471 [Stygiomarasmius scandens]|uniref:GH16 domain-containing protein n=1 Tax=Marasmiellus scandens TaxID=2682957 RepID=A0ABR1IMU7_9AGAR